MIILIAGSSHTGKTLAAQKILETYGYPYLSIDHLKMGLIRSGLCTLTPESPDEELISYLWKIVKEMIKTAIENGQNLVVEGCYIPFDWKEYFDPGYREQIRYTCLIFSEAYIHTHYSDILAHENAIENRPPENNCTQEDLLRENTDNLEKCRQYGCNYILIDKTYGVDINIEL